MFHFTPLTNSEFHFFPLSDDCQLRYAYLKASGQKEKKTILILTGKNEFIEKYLHLAKFWHEKGYNVYLLDWRYQGLSSRDPNDYQKTGIKDFTQMVADLYIFFQKVIKPSQEGITLAYAHSMGAHILLRCLIEKRLHLDGAIITSPLVQMNFSPFPEWFVQFLIAFSKWRGKLSGYALTQGPYVPQSFASQKLTSDRANYEALVEFTLQNPQLQMGGATYAWIEAALVSCQKLEDELHPLEIPVLLLSPKEDQVVKISGAYQLLNQLQLSSDEFAFYEGAKHELHSEGKKIYKEVLKTIDDWLLRYYNDFKFTASARDQHDHDYTQNSKRHSRITS